ncbi:MAG: TraR/DksA C4-type zinc finger protein [Patescibacteria group bacterium]|nr:TraR/DksA C4-type zinc finger protein [Patescibacteria group bacterium]
MNQAALDKIKSSLEVEKKKLSLELSEFTKPDVDNSDNYKSEFPKYGDDEDENAAEVADYGDRLSLEHVLEKQLRDVNKALGLIEAGTYGTCQHCGQAIEEQRLLVRPTSSSCVECKKRLTGEE